ncbi:hypothetical protein ACFXOD_34645 [Streptomyces sp. NPDC059161]|uniref:hypothetical protein n=1 Tax=Streptomyces sp. NPDC059161 TaxID=3346749 RepID=UPI00369D1410
MLKDIGRGVNEVAVADVSPYDFADAAVEDAHVTEHASISAQSTNRSLIIVAGEADLIGARREAVLALEPLRHLARHP